LYRVVVFLLLYYIHYFFFVFFFFQAEDGIRDLYVTGVQTCALPICGRLFRYDAISSFMTVSVGLRAISSRVPVNAPGCGRPACEIGERRVGKECRSRGWAED